MYFLQAVPLKIKPVLTFLSVLLTLEQSSPAETCLYKKDHCFSLFCCISISRALRSLSKLCCAERKICLTREAKNNLNCFKNVHSSAELVITKQRCGTELINHIFFLSKAATVFSIVQQGTPAKRTLFLTVIAHSSLKS